jgi:hypothetical protein
VAIRSDDLIGRTAENYRAFSAQARGRSPQYEELALAVAGDDQVLEFLAALPTAKRQPNLLFAAARYLLGEAADPRTLRALVTERGGDLAATMQVRRTQTNEPARCATLLHAIALLPQPLALIEVGASAGLTLLADRYSYRYGAPSSTVGHRIRGTDPDAPVIACDPRGPVPLPERVPEVTWRAGLDLNPLDVTSDDDMRWLDCLIWPGETGRHERLRAAIETARRDPPTVHQGDLLTELPALASQAPPDATLVVFHSAVLAYVAPELRRDFAEVVGSLNATWISNEAPGVIQGTARTSETAALPYRDAYFVLTQDTRPVALADGHGTWLHWLPPRS